VWKRRKSVSISSDPWMANMLPISCTRTQRLRSDAEHTTSCRTSSTATSPVHDLAPWSTSGVGEAQDGLMLRRWGVGEPDTLLSGPAYCTLLHAQQLGDRLSREAPELMYISTSSTVVPSIWRQHRPWPGLALRRWSLPPAYAKMPRRRLHPPRQRPVAES
jgi:hypothetical protein